MPSVRVFGLKAALLFVCDVCRDKLARVLLHGSKLLDGFDAVLSCISKLCQEVCCTIAGCLDRQAYMRTLVQQYHPQALRHMKAKRVLEDAPRVAVKRVPVPCIQLLTLPCCCCMVGPVCMQCSAWPSTPAVEQLLSAVGQAGRDVLSVVQDIACYEYKATVAGQGTQLGEHTSSCFAACVTA